MHGFTDTRGRTWELTIDVAVVKRVRGLLKINLYDAIDDGAKGMAAILNDPCWLVDVLFVVCQEQAEKKSITDEDFGRGFAGDVLEQAAEAFVEELIDFFPDRRGRQNLRTLVTKGKALGERLRDRAERAVARIDVDRIDLDSAARMLSGSSGASPANSASSPVPSP